MLSASRAMLSSAEHAIISLWSDYGSHPRRGRYTRGCANKKGPLEKLAEGGILPALPRHPLGRGTATRTRYSIFGPKHTTRGEQELASDLRDAAGALLICHRQGLLEVREL
jgi:hypothetical protein